MFLSGLPPGNVIQGHAIFRSDPCCRCERIGSLTFKLATVGKLEEIAEPRKLFFSGSFSYGLSPLVL